MSHEADDSSQIENVEETETRPLEDRLRRLDWPKPPPGLRERSLEEFRSKYLTAQDGAGNGSGAATSNGHAESTDDLAASDPREKRAS
ncbi:MAG: hypothetical protein QOJ97_787 [Solirubrobacteraceae bacterium]|jgi:hypothetical protein|nr:hypothetical protein [Solirubrobacteraceae bacterium]